jgi:hypothetical protein
MKRKKIDYTRKPWTPFVEVPVAGAEVYGGEAQRPAAQFVNSRYEVGVWTGHDATLGEYVHLSIKDLGRSARHDWRDFQRIKNALVGPEFEGIELYPAESRLVDTANQFHLFVFRTWRVPVGFQSRLVADADAPSAFAPKAVQRPFDHDARPADCATSADLDARFAAHLNNGGRS